MNSRLKKGGAIAVLAVVLIGGFEGLRLATYKDIVGVPTVCYGETRGVKMGDRYTKAQCDEMLVVALTQFEAAMRKCVKFPDAIPGKSYVAFLSLAYNVGGGAFCKSTLVRKLNAGDVRGACNELPKWNRAGGKVVRGLTLRRAKEKIVCLEGVVERDRSKSA